MLIVRELSHGSTYDQMGNGFQDGDMRLYANGRTKSEEVGVK